MLQVNRAWLRSSFEVPATANTSIDRYIELVTHAMYQIGPLVTYLKIVLIKFYEYKIL